MIHCSFFFEIQRKTNQKENPFNVSLTLHWASLRNSYIVTDGTTARNIWNLARAFYSSKNLN